MQNGSMLINTPSSILGMSSSEVYSAHFLGPISECTLELAFPPSLFHFSSPPFLFTGSTSQNNPPFSKSPRLRHLWGVRTETPTYNFIARRLFIHESVIFFLVTLIVKANQKLDINLLRTLSKKGSAMSRYTQREILRDYVCSVDLKDKSNLRIRVSELLAKFNLNRVSCNLNFGIFSLTYSASALSCFFLSLSNSLNILAKIVLLRVENHHCFINEVLGKLGSKYGREWFRSLNDYFTNSKTGLGIFSTENN